MLRAQSGECIAEQCHRSGLLSEVLQGGDKFVALSHKLVVDARKEWKLVEFGEEWGFFEAENDVLAILHRAGKLLMKVERLGCTRMHQAVFGSRKERRKLRHP